VILYYIIMGFMLVAGCIVAYFIYKKRFLVGS